MKQTFIFGVVGILGFILSSCCQHVYEISDLERLWVLDESGFSIAVDYDTLRPTYSLQAIAALELISDTETNTCYQAEEIINGLVESTLTLSLDQDIRFSATDIPAGTNLLDHSAITSTIEIRAFWDQASIKFSQDFFNQLEQPDSLIQATMTIQLGDGTELSTSRLVYFIP